MEILDFSRHAWKSANSYYDYLHNSDKGKSIVNIRSIHPISNNKFSLYLSRKIAYIDSAEVNISPEYCPFDLNENDIRIVEYNELSAYIVIVTSSRVSALLNTTPAEYITLESDLTFLVKTVREWYEHYHHKIAPPPPPEEMTPPHPDGVSDDQYQAICSALSSAISYIWGAPGTGKTQMVLANCILSYAQSNEQVILMAPTNNALEQSLRGIINVLDNKQINRRKIIRLGKATSSFLSQYPEVCEVGYYDSLVDALKQELDKLKDDFEIQKKFDAFSSSHALFKELIEKHNKFLKIKSECENNRRTLQQRRSSLCNETTQLRQKQEKNQKALSALQDQKQRQNHYKILIECHNKYRKIINTYIFTVTNLSKELVKYKDDLSDVSERIQNNQSNLISENKLLSSYIRQRNSILFKIKSFFSRSLVYTMQSNLSEQQKKIEDITRVLKSNESLRDQIQSNIDALEKSIEREHLIKAGTPELFEISQTAFGKHLSYEDLDKEFQNKLSEYTDFKADQKIDSKIETAQKELDVVISSLSEKQSIVEQLDVDLKKSDSSEKKINADIQSLLHQLSDLSIASFGKDISLKRMDEMFNRQQQKFKDFVSIPDIEQLITVKEQEYQNIMVQLKDILEERTIIACTVDYATIHYDKFASGIAGRASHLFVDEAAYCSLIKAGVFFSFDIPVTFLGDHMQLPPICEIDKQAIISNEENHNLFMWDSSAIHFPDIFQAETTSDDLLDAYVNNSPPNFYNVNVSFLKKTFRFGENLASVLDSFVYQQGFCGNNGITTEIFVIDAPRLNSDNSFTVSRAEVQAIRDYLSKSKLQDYAILTPYRKQRSMIENSLNLPQEQVLTIHSAQGREWDTVIISVVDAKRKFFISSKNKKSNGLRIVNTAISRAKKNLVLVLDLNCWSYCSNELITEIAKIGKLLY